MQQTSTALRLMLGLLAIGVVVILAVLVPQAGRPSVKNPQPVDGTTAPRGEVTVGAEVIGEADLSRVALRLDGKAVDPVIVSQGQRRWTVKYKAVLSKGEHIAQLTATDGRGRAQEYQWRFQASGPANPPRFADPLPRPNARVAAGEALVAVAAFSESDAVATVALSLNGKALTTTAGTRGATERSLARATQTLVPGSYTARAEATDFDGETATYSWSFTVTDSDAADTRYFPQTGYYIFPPFTQFWDQHGGAELLGLPLAADFEQRGVTVQWFERARLERHPNLPAGQQVVLGLLGVELHGAEPGVTAPTGGDRLFFPETKHTISGRFREFWERRGGLAQFGLPLSEEVTDGNLTVQWFERARFEYHPDLAGTPGEVQLSQLGRQLWARMAPR